jgi:hypothetical protein
MQIKSRRFRVALIALGGCFLIVAVATGTRPAANAKPSSAAPRHAKPQLATHLHRTPFWLQRTESTGQQGNNKCGVKKNLNDELKEELDPSGKRTISIAPMVTKGDTTAGSYTAVDGGIFDAILKRADIKPCESDPKDGKGKDGFIEYVSSSDVLNPGGTRSTFGYFIWNGAEGALSADYFLLFSYDRIKVKQKDGSEKIICAFEVFKFGPFPHDRKPGEIHPEADPPEWVFGYAVNGDGCLLPEVPLELARVANFVGGDKNETVKSGVDEPKEGEDAKGCRKCHDRSDQPPSSTLPFPWIKKGGEKKEDKKEEKKEEKKDEKKTEGTPPQENKATPAPKKGAAPEQPEEVKPTRVGKADIPNNKPDEQRASLPSGPMQDTLVGLVVTADTRFEDTITGRVVANPQSYRNNPALRVLEMTISLISTPDGPSLRGVEVVMGDCKPQPADSPVVCNVGSGGSVPVTLRREGSTAPIGQSAIPVATKNPQAEWYGQRGVYQTSRIFQRGSTVEITGPFNGNASNTRVEIGGREASIVAANPRERHVNIPTTCAPGESDVTMQDGLRTVRFRVTVLTLQMSADKLQLARGESTRYHVVISGFDALPDSAWQESSASPVAISEIRQGAPGFHLPKPGGRGALVLLLRNQSPQAITLDRATGGVLAISISPSDIHDGKFTMDGTLHATTAGGFVVSGKLVPLLAPAMGTRTTTRATQAASRG